MKSPRFSVVVPTFNRGPFVAEAIGSILAQTVAPDEIIVVDDGSTDNTPEILADFGDRIIVLRQPNRGVSAARNAGIEHARSDWVAFLDSDDVWHPYRVALLKKDLETADAGVHVANILLTGPGFSRQLFELRGLRGSGVWPLRHPDGFEFAMKDPYLSGIAARRDWLTAAGGFDVSIPYCEDVDLLCRMIFLGPWLANGTVVAELRRVGPTSETLSHRIRTERVSAEAVKIKTYGKLLGTLPANSDRAKLIRRMISKNWYNSAKALDGDGHRRKAAAHLMQSGRVHPTAAGWARALPPLLVGSQGYALLEKLKKPQFYRDAPASR
ncbi:MAG: glycosyl transferase family 2 [Verrucomicrobia bacterium]|nr:glycosyl transferase family 2 [Verrucomicrobiota bacterium]